MKYILRFEEIDKRMTALVGGKGANLGELSKIEGVEVPDGFCVTTEAYKDRIINHEQINHEVKKCLEAFGANQSYAVRSSATAEDLPGASFAGQYETYLNIVGADSIIEHIHKCWESMFTPRAIAYRKQNGFDDNTVKLAVVVQKMVPAEVSGIMFTADPISGNRKVIKIEAAFGLGDALVSGKVKPDKHALTEQQTLLLEQLGRKIEQHFGPPQDIEWCLANNQFYIVQSRPITTLFPIPELTEKQNQVYVSVGHQQMMTDAMKPLGLSFYMLLSPARMFTAGGRLFVDIMPQLSTAAGRHLMIDVLGKSDPLIKDALTTILERGDFVKFDDSPAPPSNHDFSALKDYDPSIVTELIEKSRQALKELKADIGSKSGVEMMNAILDNLNLRKKNTMSDPTSFSVIMTGMNAAHWINDKMAEWLNEKNVADTLTQSVPHNITSEMGLELLDVADVVRNYPDQLEYLQKTKDENFIDHLNNEVQEAITSWLDKYGMRCAGEIDITRTRWSERPLTLVPVILSNIKNLKAGESKRKFELGLQEASKKEKDLLERLRQLPDGNDKAEKTKRMIGLVRNFAGYREYPKYDIICRHWIYKQALLKEAVKLVEAKVINEQEDIYYLSFEELRKAIETQSLDYSIVIKRKEDFKLFEKLTPPRVMTSDGEIFQGKYNREHLPENAIVGLPVSSGVVEGRARVIINMEDADLEDGDILVTPFTDPSWTPLFVSIKGLVTEVGGLMTHGAVIAREYGLPAVVGVDGATKIIRDKQMIRVNGTEGFVEILE